MRLLLLLPLLLLVGCASVTYSAIERFDQYVYDSEKVELFDCRSLEIGTEFVAWAKDTNTLVFTVAENRLFTENFPATTLIKKLEVENEKYFLSSPFWRIDKALGILEYQKVKLIRNAWLSCQKIDYVPSIFFNEDFQNTFDLYLKELIVERD